MLYNRTLPFRVVRHVERKMAVSVQDDFNVITMSKVQVEIWVLNARQLRHSIANEKREKLCCVLIVSFLVMTRQWSGVVQQIIQHFVPLMCRNVVTAPNTS